MGERRTGAEDPLALRSPFLLGAFRLYLRWYFWRSFHAVRLSRTGIPELHPGRPLVLYCNHPSWWDPALLLLAYPKLFPGRRGFGPIDAVQLARYRLFRRMGMFGVETGSVAGAARFLRTASAGLDVRNTLMCITAEGGFTDPRTRPIVLRPGLAHLARRKPGAVFLPLALEYVFWNESRPEALLRFGEPVEAPSGASSVADWQFTLERGLTGTMDALAAESITRDPALFTRLFSGTSGVGGVYDLYRRSLAAAAGRSFDASHEVGGR